MTESSVSHNGVGRMRLQDNEVHVWRATVDVSDSVERQFYDLLSVDERQRANRFHFSTDRKKYVFVRGALRVLLGNYLDVPPDQLRFEYGEYGKPRLVGNHQSVSFNVSHSRGVALLAFACGRELGVDVEFIRKDVATEELAKRFFSTQEIASLSDLPEELRIQGFFDCWTRKEAYIKASGEGLAMPLNAFTVSVGPGEHAALLSSSRLQDINRYSLTNVSVDFAYSAALAVEGFDWQLSQWDWQPIIASQAGCVTTSTHCSKDSLRAVATC